MKDAYLCFMRTNMDCLIMGNFLIEKDKMELVEAGIEWLEELEPQINTD